MSVLMDALKKVEETKQTKSENTTSEELSESFGSTEEEEELHIFEITDNLELKSTLPQLDQISESSIEDFNQELLENFKDRGLPETIIDDIDNTSLKNKSFQNDEAHSPSHNWDNDFLPEFQSEIEQLDNTVPDKNTIVEESTDWNKELAFDDFDEEKIEPKQITTENLESRFNQEEKIKPEQIPAENLESRFESVNNESVNNDTQKTALTFWNKEFVVEDFEDEEIEVEQTSTSTVESVNNDTQKTAPTFPFEPHEPWQSNKKNTWEKEQSAEVKTDVPLPKTETGEDSIIHQPPQPEDAKRILAANGSPSHSSKKRTFILLGMMSIVAMGVGYLFFMPSLLTESPSTLKFGQLNRQIQQPEVNHDKPTLLSESSSVVPIPNSSPSNPVEKKIQSAVMVAQAQQPSKIDTQTSKKSTEELSTQPVQNKPETTVPKSEIPESPGNSKSEPFDKSMTSKKKKTKSLKAYKQKQKQKEPKTQESFQSQKSKNSEFQEPSLTIGEPEISPPANTPGIYVRKNVVNQIDRELSIGYNAFQGGDDNTAYQAYQRALQQDERNRDALLGLGALAMRSGNMRLSQYYYQRVLKLYPQDTYAVVALGNTLDKRSPESESQLKLLLEQTPQSAHIHFNLGTFYANQGQWAKAQQAYFDAYRYDNTQADYAYNLAISLDHLNQSSAALTYYQKALQLAQHQVVSFNPATVQKRVQTLLTHTRGSALTNLPIE
ncbi:conserved hypothetical protein [Beggiatoa sp. PS]|nr:conserved hypothetical protein [Beggiatoa sp. PS]